MWKDFKDFAIKGNVIDLAVAVVIGAAFGKIVSSLVENIITPLIGVLTGGINFKESFILTVGKAEFKFGVFFQSIMDFVIIAFAIFIFVRILSKLKREKQEEAVAPAPPVDPKEELLKEIRDLLKKEQA
ncbi:MAG: large conductance mechanosensitive channel protein MscL [Lysinibacillus sp.]